MTGYLIIAGALAVGAFIFWLHRVIKEAVVQPAGPDGVLLDARLSKKKRITAFKEQHGLTIGFFAGVGAVLLCWWLAEQM